MYDLALWTKIPKSLGINSVKQEKAYKQSLFVLEEVQAKIGKMHKIFSETSTLSDPEIEAYSRYLSSLSCLLLRNWEDIVNSSLEIIIFDLESSLSYEEKSLKKIRKSLAFCRKIKEECKTGDQVKGRYNGQRTESALNKIDFLQECVVKKYFSKNSL
ncbi:hypothetical protein SteCoe_11353 [Stentor coeruleus]|uniref:Uncharacterized protein n=1 Tax=Stentor coeruleus TaxID=5963 RepID=A0A1R2CDH7_9CILI|nr:hypothetical protein SteCoe_11353 [Stentor coeruleus]